MELRKNIMGYSVMNNKKSVGATYLQVEASKFCKKGKGKKWK